MIPGWKRASRALRLLLACALFWLAAASPGKGTFDQRAVVVMVAPARAKAAAVEVMRPLAPARALVLERLLASALRPDSADWVPIEDRYLRFCSLLS